MTPIGLDLPPDMECTLWPDGWPTWLGGTGAEWLLGCQAYDLVPMTLQSAADLDACVAQTSPLMGFVITVGVVVLGPIYLALRRSHRQ